jgi:hypothetical protein
VSCIHTQLHLFDQYLWYYLPIKATSGTRSRNRTPLWPDHVQQPPSASSVNISYDGSSNFSTLPLNNIENFHITTTKLWMKNLVQLCCGGFSNEHIIIVLNAEHITVLAFLWESSNKLGGIDQTYHWCIPLNDEEVSCLLETAILRMSELISSAVGFHHLYMPWLLKITSIVWQNLY